MQNIIRLSEQLHNKSEEDFIRMKRIIILLFLVLTLSLLFGCAKMKVIYEETPAVLASGYSESSAPELSPQETDSSAPSVSLLEASGDDTSQESPALTSPGETTQDAKGHSLFLSQTVSAAGLSLEDFDFSQLVLVAANGSSADIYCYDKTDNGLWKFNMSIGCVSGYAGRNGVSLDKREGDGCSPGGLFRLGYAFGNKLKPLTGMEYRALTKDTYWIDDPNSKYYNQWVEGTDGADWTGGEHLSENVVSYSYAIVIEYNTLPNIVAGKGSAIFFHIGNKPTSGCVVVTEETLLKILKWLSVDNDPRILIVAK